jgi:hypothetical protein
MQSPDRSHHDQRSSTFPVSRNGTSPSAPHKEISMTSLMTRSQMLLARLVAMLAIGLFMLSVGASTTFAGNDAKASDAAGNGAPIVSSDGGQVTLNEDDEDEDDEDEDDEDEEDEDEGGGGGSLPATDTAPEIAGNAGTTSPVPAVAVLVIAGLVGGAVKVASKRKI